MHVNGTPGVQRYSWLCDLGGSGVGSTGVLTPYGGTTQGNYYVTPSVPSVVSSVVATPTGEQVQTPGRSRGRAAARRSHGFPTPSGS